MIRIFILFCAFLMFTNAAYSTLPNTTQLSNIEKTLFGFENEKDTETNRLALIEKHLYGSVASGNVTSRITKISTELGVNQNTTVASSETTKTASKTKRPDPAPIKEDSSVEYPIVDKIEQQVLKEVHKGENIYARLDRLETRLYQKTSDEDLSARVNKLRLSVLKTDETSDDLYSYTSDYDKMGKNSYSRNGIDYGGNSYSLGNPPSASDIKYAISAIEENMLKRTYESDPINTRLGRLEAKIFKREFPSEAEIERIERIAAAANAKKSSQMYDNNKLMRNLATGAQVGGFLLMILAMLL